MMIEHEKQAKPRPYWHVDFKWVEGITLFFALSAALLLYNLTYLTERERAINLSASIVASLFSRDGLDDEKSLTELRQKATLIPGDTIAPIPQFSWLTIAKSDLMTLDARELRLKIFSQITEPIYDSGIDGAAKKLTQNPAEQEQFKKDAALLSVFTRATHETLQQALYVALALAVLALAGVIYFSAGWGRLVTPGVILLLISPLGVIFSLLLRYPPKDGDAPFGAIPPNVAETISSSLANSYVLAAVAGASLLVIALVGKIIQAIVRGRAKS